MIPRQAGLVERAGATLVLVDYQERLMPMIHAGASVVERARRLAKVADLLGIPVVGTEQNPDKLGANVPAIRQRCASTLSKMHFDACADGLLDLLAPGSGEVVVAGCEAHVCLLQTAMGLAVSGRRVTVIADACGSRSPEDHRLAMQRLARCGISVLSVEMVVFEWLRSCEHPNFRECLAEIKPMV
jgi:nicotinamidase-related amidase